MSKFSGKRGRKFPNQRAQAGAGKPCLPPAPPAPTNTHPIPLEFLVSSGEFWERKKRAGGWVQRIPNPHFLLAEGQEFSG